MEVWQGQKELGEKCRRLHANTWHGPSSGDLTSSSCATTAAGGRADVLLLVVCENCLSGHQRQEEEASDL